MAGPFLVGRNIVVIDVPARLVFEYLADLAHLGEWTDETDFVVRSRPVGPPGLGANIQREKSGVMQGPLILRGGMGESRVTMAKFTTITVYEPETALVIETRNSYNSLLHSIEKFTFDFGPEMDGTRVTMVSEVEAMVPSMFIGPVYAIRLVRGVFERILGKRLSRLFPDVSVGPHLSRIKEITEAGRIADSN